MYNNVHISIDVHTVIVIVNDFDISRQKHRSTETVQYIMQEVGLKVSQRLALLLSVRVK